MSNNLPQPPLPQDDHDFPVIGVYEPGQGILPVQGVGAVNVDATNNNQPSVEMAVDEFASGGVVAPYGSNLGATAATTDYQFKWGPNGTTQVNHVLIQNNTAAAVQFELDQTANAGSISLPTGQPPLILHIQCTVLHLFTAAIQNVNGNAANNIVVRSWL